MSLHQYIGARYVPYYYQNSLDPTSTEWEPNVSYESLTIVSLPNNHSYISKKSVPDSIGSPALNAEYWLDQGSRDAYIQDLQDQIDDINTKIDNINNGKYKCGVVIGNSYARGQGSPDNYGLYYYINNALLEEGHLYAGTGTGFTDYDGAHTNDTFLTHLNDAINDPNLDKDAVDVIFVLGAWGDSREYIQQSRVVADAQNAIEPAIASFVSDAIANFPNLARIYYTNAESRGVNKKVTGSFTSYVDDTFMTNLVMNPIIDKYGIINLGWTGLAALYKAALFATDMYHLNTDGYAIVSQEIINRVRGSKNPLFFTEDYDLDISAFTGIADSKLSMKTVITEDDCSNEMFYAQMPAGNLSLPSTYAHVYVDSVHAAPFSYKCTRNRVKSVYTPVNGSPNVVSFRPEVNNNGMYIDFRVGTAVSATTSGTTSFNISNYL